MDRYLHPERREHHREDDMTTPLGQIVYGHLTDPRWETTQEIPRGDVATAVRLSQFTGGVDKHPVLDMLATSEPVVLSKHLLGYDPYDSERVARWDRRRAQVARGQKMARQARVMFGTRARRVLNLRLLKQETLAIAWLDVTIVVLGTGLACLGWLVWHG